MTPNMHMHGHLKDATHDYGPIHSFWLFSFEPYNGILGNQPNNNRLIEPQLMQHFLHDNMAYSLQFKEDFSYICTPNSRVTGSVSETCSKVTDTKSYILPTKGKYATFEATLRDNPRKPFSKLRPQVTADIVPNTFFVKYSAINLCGKNIHCSQKKPSIALAEWNNHLFGTPPSEVVEPSHPASMPKSFSMFERK